MVENNRWPDESQNTNQEKKSVRNGTSNRGFASMTPEKQKEIASKGGKAAHEQGVAHQWSSDEARAAGRKGGQSVSQNRQHMAEIGRKGGQASRGGGRTNTKNQSDTIEQTDSENGSSENSSGSNERSIYSNDRENM